MRVFTSQFYTIVFLVLLLKCLRNVKVKKFAHKNKKARAYPGEEYCDKKEITLDRFCLLTIKGYFCSDLNSNFISLYPHFLLNISIFLKSFYKRI